MAPSTHLQPNAELQAQRLMSQVMQGDQKEFEQFINSQIHPEMLRHVLDQLKFRGNEEFQKGNYDGAIEFYNQALAGTKDAEAQSLLLNNKSAALLASKKYKEALEVSGHTIQLNPSWNKAWFRAGRILYEMKSYTSALKVFNVALMKDDRNKEIRNWVKKTEPLAMKEKALERVSVDYTRFEHIEDENEEPSNIQHDEDPAIALEFADDLSEQERRQLENLLTGRSTGVAQPGVRERIPPHPTFNPQLVYNSDSSKNELAGVLKKGSKLRMKEKVKLCLLSLLQVQSGLDGPRRVAQKQLLSSRSPGYRDLQALVESIKKLERQEDVLSDDHSRLQTTRGKMSFFFLGIGTSIPLITAVKIYSHRPDARFIACSNHRYPFLGWIADRMFSINDVDRDNTKIISKSIQDVTVASAGDSLLDSELVDIPDHQLSTVLILDPDLFDSTGLGRRALYDIREARKRFMVGCREDGLQVFPCRMRLEVHAAEMKSSFPTLHCNSIDKARWSINWEPVDNIHKKEKHGGYKRLSSNIPIFEFVFDGPLERIDDDIPLNGIYEFDLPLHQSGCFNAFVLSVVFSYPRVIDSSTEPLGSSMLWIDSLDVKNNDVIRCEARQDGSRLRLKTSLPSTFSSNKHYSMAIPRWQFDIIDDSGTIECWNLVLADTLQEIFRSRTDRIDRRRSSIAPSKSNNVEVLLLNSSLGYLSVEALRCAASVFASRRQLPSPSFHATAVETSLSQSTIARFFVKDNHHLVTEDSSRYMESKESKWKSFLVRDPPIDASQEQSLPSDKVQNEDGSGLQSTGKSKSLNCEKGVQQDEGQPDAVNENTWMKIRSRLSILTKDPRQLRPPNENGTSRLALATLIGAPLGSSGPEIPPAGPGDSLNDRVDLIVNQMMDNGLLGEGILPVLSYCRDALMKPNGKIIPFSGRICAMGVYLGRTNDAKGDLPCPSDCHHHNTYVKSDCWNYLIGGNTETGLSIFNNNYKKPEYTSYNYHPENQLITVMTESVEVFQFRFDCLSFYSVEQLGRTKSLSFKSIREGPMNGILYWYDLLLESSNDAKRRGRNQPIGFTTCPVGITSPSTSTQDSANQDQYKGDTCTEPPTPSTSDDSQVTSNWFPLKTAFHSMQALQMLPQLAFSKGETVPVIASHTKTDVSFFWNRLDLKDIELRRSYSAELLSEARLIDSWRFLSQHHLETLNQTNEMYTNSKINRLASDAAISIAINPGRYALFSVDPEQALWFCLSFFY